MRADGSGARRLRPLAAPAGASGLAWSPDGSRLAFVTGAHGNVLWRMDADGSRLVRIVLRAGEVMSPTWSPDGSRIAFSAYRDGDRDIWLMNSDGSGQRRLARTPRLGETELDWSRTGEIAFADWRSRHVYAIGAGGGNRRDLTPGAGSFRAPHWSPDGGRLAFVGGAPYGGEEIYVSNADGTRRLRLTTNELSDADPGWSSDGSRIVFVRSNGSQGQASPEIYLMNPDGTGLSSLTHTPRTAEWSPAWQPVAAT